MLSFKCRSCGGEMSVDSNGSLVCEYCGSSFNLKDEDIKEYRIFRSAMLSYLRRRHDEIVSGESEDHLWDMAKTVILRSADGEDITIRYLYTSDKDGVKMFLTRNNILYVFEKSNAQLAGRSEDMVSQLQYPSADMRSLKSCFPMSAGSYKLEGGGIMLAYERDANMFPLNMFGALTPEHAAWVVSRMENICCVLEYSGITHGGISADSIFINPFSHRGALIGSWWNAKRGITRGRDLKDLRDTAAFILGRHKGEEPAEFTSFLKSRPKDTAYDDFAQWDRVIEDGFGGRRFAVMDNGPVR